MTAQPRHSDPPRSPRSEVGTERVGAACLRPGDVIPSGGLGGSCAGDRTVDRVELSDRGRIALVYFWEHGGYLPVDPRTSFDRIVRAS